MNEFSRSISQLKAAFNRDLPGVEQHLKMAPYNKTSREIARKVNPNPRESAVLILVYPDNNIAHTALMLRNDYKGTHGGQVSFPGGKREVIDTSLEETALRETYEEFGIDPTSVDLIGQLTEIYIPPSGFLVFPFIGLLDSKPEFIPDPREVKELIETPLDIITQPNTIKIKKIPVGLSGIKVEAPYFDIQNHVVWGATAMILSELKAILLHETI